MRRLLCLFLALVLALGLCACGNVPVLIPRTHEDLTIGIPEDFIDLSQGEFARELTFLYGWDPIAVSGLRQTREYFESYGLDLDLEGYARLTLLANEVDAQLTEKDGILTFSYESQGFCYLVTLWQTQTAFWTVQAFCPTESFADSQSQMWEILRSIAV